ncbi:cytochrome P450 [Auriculariales sp. MPI-PUGE-AT-0066]|nr:cytochrome P450 [Auriculariales sp. MPI-PUGE-AT-0066]
MSLTHIGIPAAFVALYAFYYLKDLGKRDDELPPGWYLPHRPPTIPIFGNMHHFPKEFAQYKFTEWAQQYGEIFSLKMAGETTIVLTSIESVRELMDRRSATTVDRPSNFVADRTTSLAGLNMAYARYGESWRCMRRSTHTILTSQSSTEHLHIQEAEAAQLLYDILNEPEKFHSHIRRSCSSVLLSALFGRRAPRCESPEAEDFFQVQNLWYDALKPGAHSTLDLLPVLANIPEWWSPWKSLSRKIKHLQHRLYSGFFDECEHRVQTGKGTGCFAEQVIERREELGLSREQASHLGGVLLEGGSDTTSSYLQTLVLAMVAYPEVQHKAQAELDSVVGHDRAPAIEDLAALPYIQALIKEIHRWRPVQPLLPHGTLSDEHYKGYLIPKDATIYINNWGIFHDEKVFENAESFLPERFLKNVHGVRDGVNTRDFRPHLEFGYGRRVCPGIHIANNSISLNVMKLLWAFSFTPYVNADTGEAEAPDIWNYTKGLHTCPKPFNCKIMPRYPEITSIVNRDFFAAAPVFQRYEQKLAPEDHDHVTKLRADKY